MSWTTSLFVIVLAVLVIAFRGQVARTKTRAWGLAIAFFLFVAVGAAQIFMFKVDTLGRLIISVATVASLIAGSALLSRRQPKTSTAGK